ncbi:MAG: N-acetylmuramoyl-L-alanine amidase, partial [Hyphomicrobium sp.]
MQFQVIDDRLLSGGRAVPFVPTPNQGGRIEPALIVIHFTADHLDPKDSVNWFAQKKSKVSAHLVVGRNGEVTQMVDFDRLAFHAGKSAWNGRSGCNGFAIGIEIDNPGALRFRGKDGVAWHGDLYDREQYGLVEHESEKYGHALWMPYTDAQMAAVRGIIQALLRAYPSIVDIRGHDEICVPAKRKNDPGPLMDMDALRELLGDRAPEAPQTVADAQKRLAALGYWPGDVDGLMGPRTRSALRDFQDQNGLPITGNVDTATWLKLSDGTGKPMPT